MTEKLCGLTYDRLTMDGRADDGLELAPAQAAREALPTMHQPFDPPAVFVTTRLSPSRAKEINQKLREIPDEVEAADRSGRDPYGLVVSLFRTDTQRVETP